MPDRKTHWENVYQTRPLEESGWYQPVPVTSLEFIEFLDVPKSASIIDVGGGDSLLVDHLLKRGYENLTVLDISEKAIERAKARIGKEAKKVKWIVNDITTFEPHVKYDCWHDRAAFHFLIEEADIEKYVAIARTAIKPGGYMILGTFSTQGPQKCSGLTITQYSEASMQKLFHEQFEKVKCKLLDHITPSGGKQHYVFCGFERR